MAGSPASLVVSVSADITDFSKQLDSMTRGVDKAAKQLELVGDVLKVAITEKVIEAGKRFLELGADADATAARMQRAFGGLSGEVNDALEKMTRTVPETKTELEALATHLENVVEGMGIAPANAARMSEALLQVAANAAAVAHVPIGEALDALSHSLAGRGRELVQFGLGFNQAEVKAKAMTLGLLDQGNQLTETGTALASYALIMDRAGRINGAAAQSVNDADKQLQFFKRDVQELGEHLAAVFLPTLLHVVDYARGMVDAFSRIPTPVYATAGAIAAIVAVLIPLGIGITKIIKAFVELRAAFTVLAGGGSILGFFASLTNPIGWVIIGTVALTAAVLGLVAAYEKLKGANPADQMKQAREVLDNDPTLVAALQKQGAFTPANQKNAPTQLNPKDAYQILQENAATVGKLFDQAVQHGSSLLGLNRQINALYGEAGHLLDGLNGKLDATSQKNREIVQSVQDQLQRLKDIEAVRDAPGTAAAQNILNQIAARPVDIGALGAASAVDAANKYRVDLATRAAASQYATPFNAEVEAGIQSRGQVQSVTNDLNLRQTLLELPDGFNAAKLAAVQYAESQRQDQEQTALAFETIKLKLGPFGQALDGLSSGMQRVVVSLYDSAISFAQSLASTIGGSGKGAATGRGIGGLVGGIVGSIIPGVGTVVGAAVGGFIGTAAGGLIGGAFDHAKKSVDNTSTAMDALAKTVDKVNQSISNIPQYFKVEYYRYLAAPVVPPPTQPTPPPTYPPPGGGPIAPNPDQPTGIPGAPNPVVFNVQTLNINNPVANAKDLLKELGQAALKQAGTGSASRFAFATARV